MYYNSSFISTNIRHPVIVSSQLQQKDKISINLSFPYLYENAAKTEFRGIEIFFLRYHRL